MKCPVCKLENPNEAIICDCGHNFLTNTGGIIIKKSLEPLVEGLFTGVIIHSIVIILFLCSLAFDRDNLQIGEFNSLILIIGIWQWIYIIPIDILLLKKYKKYKKGFVTGINISSGVLAVINTLIIIWLLHDISFLPTFT